MKIPVFQRGFNYSQDGPGNRLVYHLQGCNLKCPWCSNPEGMRPYSPQTAGRGTRELDVEEIIAEALACSPMFFDGGGITLTGGEPTLFFSAIHALFSGLKRQGVSCAIETNGTCPQLEELFPLVDFLIIDCKHYDAKCHRQATGLGNETILKNLERAAKMRKQLLVRVPLIGGVNARPEDIEGFLRFFSSINTPALSVELLPYHEYGKGKWEQLGLAYAMKGAFVPPEFVRQMKARLLQGGIRLAST